MALRQISARHRIGTFGSVCLLVAAATLSGCSTTKKELTTGSIPRLSKPVENMTAPELARAADSMRARVPGLNIALTHAPGFPFDPVGEEAAQIITRIRDSGARLCFLALGAPRQERFAIHARDALGNVGFASIGAGLDFLSGHQRRAPQLVRKVKMEWAWRMLSNPRRLFLRYVKGFTILPGHVRKAMAIRAADREGRS